MIMNVHVPQKTAWPAISACFPTSFTVKEDQVVSDTGVCAGCGLRLRSVDLKAAERAELLSQIDTLVVSTVSVDGQQACAGAHEDVERRATQWATFRSWLDGKPEPYEAVIDGANVGFFNSNYAGAPESVDFRQIDLVLKHCVALNRKTLIVLHARHLIDDRLPDYARPIIAGWRRAGQLYSCALRNNDDWYWLYAAVRSGERSILVSNDEMRDHHFGMLSSTFLVWKERHLTKYSLGNWLRMGGREIRLDQPPPFSLRMQTELSDDGQLSALHAPALLAPASVADEAPRGQAKATVVVARTAVEDTRWLCCSAAK